MKATDLPTVWGAPDNTRLTSKQFSFRLPVHVAAKLAALCDMYPGKTRTQLVADLLSAALKGVEDGFPSVKGRAVVRDPDEDGVLFEDVGAYAIYRTLANKYHADLERELGNEDPKPVLPERLVTAKECGE